MIVSLAVVAVLAVVGLILVGLSQHLPSPEQQGQNQHQPASQGHNGEQRPAAEKKYQANGWTKIKQAIERNEKVVTALSTAVIAAFTIALVLATGFLYFSSEKVADAAKESADVARDALIAANRAWLGLEVELIDGLIHEADAARVTIKYTLKNYGTAAGTNVLFEPKFILHDWGQVDGNVIRPGTHIQTELHKWCEELARPMIEELVQTNWFGGATIFPTQEDSDRFKPHIPLADMATAAAQGDRGTFRVYLLVCSTYHFPADKRAHYTGRAYDLLRRDGEAFRPGENVPLANLALRPAWFGTGIAN